MEEAVHLLNVEHVALVSQVMVDPNVSIVLMKAAHLSPAKMKDYALKRPAFHIFNVSVELGSKESAVSRSTHLLSLLHLHALWQTVTVKPVMVFVTKNAIPMPASGTEGTAP